jgi:translocation and assembly module TamA
MFPARPDKRSSSTNGSSTKTRQMAGKPPRPRILAQLMPKVLGPVTLLLASGSILVAPSYGYAAEAAREAVKYTVRIDAPEALETLLENNLDLVRYRDNPRTDREQLQRLVRGAPEQVKTLIATAGYYTPQVSARLDTSSATPAVIVTVEPGEPVLVGSVDLELQGFKPMPASSTGPAFDADALKASWTLKEGEIFRQSEWETAKRGLLRQVVQTRYPRAQISESLATVDPEAHRAALRVVLDSGPEMRFGELRIEGLKRYPASIISNLNQIKPGDYYSEAALQAYQAKLQDTGYFSSVEVSADLSSVLAEQIDTGKESQPDTETGAPAQKTALDPNAPMAPLPLVVRVVENKEKNVTAGLGFSTNTGNRAQLAYDDLNVFGLKFRSALTLETKQQTASGTFYFPTSKNGYNDSVGASHVHSDISGEVTTTDTVAAKRTWGTSLLERTLTLEYLKEAQSVNGADTRRSKSVPLTFGITSRKLDSLLFPTRGYVVNASLGAAVLPVLTDERFLRGDARFIYYRPLGARSTVILRGELGALGSKEKSGVPSTYLFRAGGDQSVRGYAYQELGVQENGATVGGRYLLVGSAEYQYWFKPTWGAAAFYDAGNAADSLRSLGPKSGYGLGVRYKSPVGPINVDVAYGHAVKKIRMHFSLGFTF